MPKTKKSASKSALGFKPKFKFDKTLLLVIIAVVVATGGFLFYQASHAATMPPASLRRWVAYGAGSANHAHSSTAYVNTVSDTTFGPATPVLDMKTDDSSHYRAGNWNFLTNSFTATTGYLKVSGSSITANTFTCKSGDNVFYGLGPLQTVYGDTYYGQIYRLSGSKWQVAWASFNTISHACATSSGWLNVTAGTLQ